MWCMLYLVYVCWICGVVHAVCECFYVCVVVCRALEILEAHMMLWGVVCNKYVMAQCVMGGMCVVVCRVLGRVDNVCWWYV